MDEMAARFTRIRQAMQGIGFDGDTEAGLRAAVSETVSVLEEVVALVRQAEQSESQLSDDNSQRIWQCARCRQMVNESDLFDHQKEHARVRVEHMMRECPDCVDDKPCARAAALEGR